MGCVEYRQREWKTAMQQEGCSFKTHYFCHPHLPNGGCFRAS